MMLTEQLGFILTGFLGGSVLFSQYLPLAVKRVDVEALSEDHNPGAANAIKYGGVPLGLFCLFLDMFKGFLPVYTAGIHLGPKLPLFFLIMAAPVAGHAFSVFNRGRGGKAIAVSFGVLIALLPEIKPLFWMCVIYLFFSLVVVVHPNEKRTVVTFSLFAVLMGIFGIVRRLLPQLCIGCVLISCIVVYKNRQREYVGE